MTANEILKIAKKTSCKCCECNSTVKSTVGKPVFGNGTWDCKIDVEGRTYCYSCANRLAGKIGIVIIPDWSEPNRITDENVILSKITDMEDNNIFFAYEKNEHIRVRCMKENANNIFVFKKNSHRYGRRYAFSTFVAYYDLDGKKDRKEVNENSKWHKRIERAIKCLEKSGLWTDVLEKLRNLYLMEYEDRNYIRQNYAWRSEDNKPLIEKYESKYPFLFYKSADNSETYIDTFYIYEMSEITFKSMYFGKYGNDSEKKTIAEKIAKREDYKTRARTSYDVSFSYDSKTGKAYYSEEYKGCGNGHYYIALDNSTALFCEDD